MPSCSNSEPDKPLYPMIDNNIVVSDQNPPNREVVDDEDEDEDADFNPVFLKETLSPEPSSSLSSEDVATQATERFREMGIQEIVDTAPLLGETGARRPAIDLDADDAICTRTRARYSLASFTLDELETFLQETDDEDDLQNVDDEQEYRKFLSFVLQGGDHGDTLAAQDCEIPEDDDEDNDADFEIELEEALESDADVEENANDAVETEHGRGRRPQTRQNRSQKGKDDAKKKCSTQAMRALRPILPVFSIDPVSSFTALPSVEANASAFTQQQIGQLHCLIHEHVQLLIQMYCMCVDDSSRHPIASQARNLILEMVEKRDEVMVWKSAPYPKTCFHPKHLSPMVPGDVLEVVPMAGTLELYHSTSGTDQVDSGGGLFWAPCIGDPVTTILDVAPLCLAGKFFSDVEIAVQASRLRSVESNCETRFVKEPLFPLPGYQLVAQANSEVSASSGQEACKKTIAATIIESAKKQSVALVPRHITKLAQIFLALFNPELYPYKPPPAPIANRILFTDSEDALLALGILEYNTDWKAIQQRFLPCKSKHQIFVRQKNRSSSKARENPIKAVKRMKSSPLTEEEIASIHEGLKVYKCNLMMVWQFIVPHRDPSLLPRQWRIALGTQKSYKHNAEARERRRLNEVNKRSKSAGLARLQNKENTQAEKLEREYKNVEDNAGKTYVHEAFLADWRPHEPNVYLCSDLMRNPHTNMLSQGVFQQRLHNHVYGRGPQLNAGNIPQHPFHFDGVRIPGPTTIRPDSSASTSTSNVPKPQLYVTPYRDPKSYGKNLVRLAPGLPPVNLPPSVRIVSQSAIRDSRHGSLSVPVSTQAAHAGRLHISNVTKGRGNSNNTEDCESAKDKCVEDERSNDSDFQMHPLLFQAADDSRLPYYQLNPSASSSGSFSFFSGNQPQLDLSLVHNPQQVNHAGHFPSSLHSTESTLSHGIDFHPLLQSSDYLLQYPFGTAQTQPLDNSDPRFTGKSVEKANELDLEIHLSSRGRKPTKSTSNRQDSDFNIETQPGDELFYQSSENPLPSISNPDSGVHSPVVQTEGSNRYLDDMCDQSNPGIVMEQEELSDSDEENEENVEFECEEMTDSEGDEGSGCEQITPTQIEVEHEHNLTIGKASSDCEPKSGSHSRRKLSGRKKKTPSLELGLTNQGKDNASKSSWLRLDSSGWQHCRVNTTGNEHEDCAINKGNHSIKSLASSRPSRSCKKKSLSCLEQVDQRRPVDGNRKVSLAPRIPILRKPRKRARRVDASLNVELKVQNANCSGEDSGS